MNQLHCFVSLVKEIKERLSFTMGSCFSPKSRFMPQCLLAAGFFHAPHFAKHSSLPATAAPYQSAVFPSEAPGTSNSAISPNFSIISQFSFA